MVAVLLLGSVWLWPLLTVLVGTGTLLTAAITRRTTAIHDASARRLAYETSSGD